MKKLLLLLLCVPLIYSCQQNNPNPNNPAGTFLENNDGAVYNHLSGLGGVVTNVLNNTDFSFEIVYPFGTGLYEFIQDGNNQIIIHITLDGVLVETGVFTKSTTETNLACN